MKRLPRYIDRFKKSIYRNLNMMSFVCKTKTHKKQFCLFLKINKFIGSITL